LAVLGSLSLRVETRTPDLVADLWITVVRRLIDPSKETLHEVEMLSALLLAGTYEAESSRPAAARMRGRLEEALALTTAITDEWHRRRRARAWLAAGRAALGSGDQPLAEAIAAGIRADLRAIRTPADAFAGLDDDELYGAIFAEAAPVPELPDTHTKPEVIAAFKALLDKPGRRRRRRQPPAPPPSE
jgi:hypothetical protein